LGFGKLTNIELAGESEWFIEGISTVSDARFYNNTFGQGLLATPLQIAAAYAPLVNGWYYVKPTIIKWMYDTKSATYYPNQKKIIRQIFRPETSEALKIWLLDVVLQNWEVARAAFISGYTIGGKSWTSQISYKGKYERGNGWTNASFVGLLTQENPKYIVIVQVRRPRKTQWWFETAWAIFKEVAKFLINYALIEK
jgi:cell division protein FtsI (penicillin-binding protein 3)